jgi:elongation factor P--beta-lysine ligase
MQIEKIVLERSEDCFDLAKAHHELAEMMHQVAAQQIDNAEKQKVIAAQQHINAAKVDAKAETLGALGSALEADALQVMGDTIVVQRGVPARPSGSVS